MYIKVGVTSLFINHLPVYATYSSLFMQGYIEFAI